MNRRETLKSATKVVKTTTRRLRSTRSTRSTADYDDAVKIETLDQKPNALKVTKIKSTARVKKTTKPKRTLYEDSLGHIEVPPDYSLPKSFLDYHSDELIAGVKHILKVDPTLYKPIVSSNFEKFKREADPKVKSDAEIIKSYWLDLVSSVMAQQISGSAASAIYNRFKDLYTEGPNPKETATFTTEQLRGIGLSYSKVKYVHHISEVFSNPNEKLAQMDFYRTATAEELTQELTKLKGIGEWSAQMFEFFTLRKLDVFAPGDLGIARGAAYYLSKRPELVDKVKKAAHADDEVRALLKKKGKFDKPSSKRDWVPYHDEYLKQLATYFQPYRSLFMLILWRLSSTNVEVLAADD